MLAPISTISRLGYKWVAKPILFKTHPDIVHEQLVKVGGFVGKTTPLRGLIHGCWAYSNTDYLKTSLSGVEVQNPVGLSAGFDNNFTLVPLLKAVGFGFTEGGSLTLQETTGNPRPWFHRLPYTKSLVVNKGLSNEGAEKIVTRITAYKSSITKDFPINISVAKTNSPGACSVKDAVNDYVGSLKIIKKQKAGAMITINISCPNTYGGEPFTTPKNLTALLKAVDTLKLKQPLFLKMPSNLSWKEFKALADIAAKHNVQGLTVHNLAKTRKDVDPRDTLTKDIKGNLSGKPTWKSSNEFIKKTRQTYGDRFVIIGVGGIFSAKDAYTKIRLGADAVELITGMIFNGPQLIGQINKGLVKLLQKDGYTNISQAVGVDAKK